MAKKLLSLDGQSVVLRKDILNFSVLAGNNTCPICLTINLEVVESTPTGYRIECYHCGLTFHEVAIGFVVEHEFVNLIPRRVEGIQWHG